MICPRHGSTSTSRTGVPRSSPAFEPVATYPGHRRGRGGDGEVLSKSTEVVRCWETTDPQYNAYHDEEWGRPVTTERGLRAPRLEGFQSGLSWSRSCASARRFAAAFESFDPDRVAAFDERDIERLLARRVDHAAPREDRSGDRKRPGDDRAAHDRHPAGRALLVAPPGFAIAVALLPGRGSASTPESATLSKNLRRAGFHLSARRPRTRPCKRAVSSTTTSPAAGSVTRSRPSERHGIRPDPSARLWVSAERRWSGVGDFKYGQWRYQLVEACPRDLTGTA